jgi:hypothetical protein
VRGSAGKAPETPLRFLICHPEPAGQWAAVTKDLPPPFLRRDLSVVPECQSGKGELEFAVRPRTDACTSDCSSSLIFAKQRDFARWALP